MSISYRLRRYLRLHLSVKIMTIRFTILFSKTSVVIENCIIITAVHRIAPAPALIASKYRSAQAVELLRSISSLVRWLRTVNRLVITGTKYPSEQASNKVLQLLIASPVTNQIASGLCWEIIICHLQQNLSQLQQTSDTSRISYQSDRGIIGNHCQSDYSGGRFGI